MDQRLPFRRLDKRLRFQNLLEEILGSRDVYFQPQENTRLNYPCIIYTRASPQERFANNDRYLSKEKFLVTVIDRDPDSEIPEDLLTIPLSSLDRTFIADSLNHTVIEIYH